MKQVSVVLAASCTESSMEKSIKEENNFHLIS